ncbi:hypothetical protein OSB04_005353 [Centaurea solstitialis]|uniref:USP domain-containing protein n=1 Tax=Centaurea solstitialis TaxID=347529 RepID=A0AA38TNH3_9ASTR|nr:hypothetical protein OSB04_005353 [Centaurea solstitialis]
MGHKKRNFVTRSKPVTAAVSTPPLSPIGNHGGHGGDGDEVSSVAMEPNLSVSSSSAGQVVKRKNEVALESDGGYSSVKVECEKALTALRRGNHKKALRLMKEMCGKHENLSHLALIHRVQGTICVKVASIIDDLNVKQRYLRNAVESAKKAVVLSPNSIEFAHFYANLLYESANEGKDYEEVVQECERALAVENPVDPGKESLQDESQQKISTADARIGHVQNELRSLVQKSNIASISSWMKNLGNGEEKFRLIPLRRVPDDPMDVRLVQARRPNEIKKASKTDEERKKEIEVKVAAARLLQQKLESSQSQSGGDKGSEVSSGSGQRVGERRKSAKVRRNVTAAERKDCVHPYWKSMSLDSKKDLLKIKISDIKAHFRSLKDGLPLLPNLQEMLPPSVDNEWTEMLLTFPWKALDVNAAIKMVEMQSNSVDANFVDRPYPKNNSELSDDCFTSNYCSDDAWDSSSGLEKYENPCNDVNSESREYTKIPEVTRECDQNQVFKASHLTKVIQFAVEELHTRLLNCGVDQSPICICFLGAPELRKVLKFLQELSHSCGLSRYSEKGNVVEELNRSNREIEMTEKVVFNEDGSCLLLDSCLLLSKLSADTSQDTSVSSENGVRYDNDSLLSWIFSGPTSGEQLTFWMRSRDEKVHQGMEILQVLEKEFNHLHGLCERKLEHTSYEEALQQVEDLCLEEGKKREHATESAHRSYEFVLRKRHEELTGHGNDSISTVPINKFEFGFEETYSGVNSHLCDLEAGEGDDWRAKDYLHQVDSCIEVAIQKQKEQLSIEALLEDLAEKDATEKSDAAREAFLAELALDSKKGSVDNSKQSNDKLKDKRKNRDYRKIKDSKATNNGEPHVLADVNAEKGYHPSPLADDGHQSETVAEIEDPFSQLKDEARRRKDELEAEERKLEETLEYQRRIENEAKQKHLAEQLKNNLSATSMRNVPVETPAVYVKHNIDNHTDNELRPSRQAPLKQSNGILSKLEGLSDKDREGAPRRTGLHGGIAEDGVLLSDQKTGRKSRRQKNATKLIDGKQQPVSLEKENIEVGQVTHKDGFKDDSTSLGKWAVKRSCGEIAVENCNAAISGAIHRNFTAIWDSSYSGENGTKTLRQLQAEEDDEERFQADLLKAVRQSLEGKDSRVTSIELSSDKANGSDVYGTGLQNEAGEYNCFLNVIIQSLWHLRRFREEFLRMSTSTHRHVGDPCVTCALYDIFIALNMASTDTKGESVAPTSLRIALSNLYPDSSNERCFRSLGSDIYCLHQSFTSGSAISDTEPVESNVTGAWECANSACTAHSLFGMDIFERMNCYNCGLESRRMKYTSFFHQINANALGLCRYASLAVMCPESSFDELLNLVEMNHQLACDPEDGGCGKPNYIHHILSTPPHVFTTVLGWQNTCESVEDIKATLAALATEIDISVLYRGLDPMNSHRLVSVVCYYGQHYHCFAYNHDHERWMMYDDNTVKVIGSWEDVLKMCEKGHLQPQVLFYEAVD